MSDTILSCRLPAICGGMGEVKTVYGYMNGKIFKFLGKSYCKTDKTMV